MAATGPELVHLLLNTGRITFSVRRPITRFLLICRATPGMNSVELEQAAAVSSVKEQCAIRQPSIRRQTGGLAP